MPGSEFEPRCPLQKKDTTFRRVLLFGFRGKLKCSAEVNSASAKVLPPAKRLYGAGAPPALWTGWKWQRAPLNSLPPPRAGGAIQSRGEAGFLRMAGSHSRDAGKRVRASLPAPKKGHDISSCPSFWIPWEIEMLGRSQFRLRQGFASGKTLVRRRGAAGPLGRK